MHSGNYIIDIFIGDGFVCTLQHILLTYWLEKVSCAHCNTFYEPICWRRFRLHTATYFINIFIGERSVCTRRYIL